MKLAIVLVTLPVVAVAGLSTRPLDPQGVGEREPFPSTPATQPASAPSAAPARGEIAVTLISKSGEVVDHDWFNLIRLDDGSTVKSSSPDAKEGGQLIFTDLQPGRYEVEAKDFSTGYVDVLEGSRSTITISVADWSPTVVSGRVMRGETGVPGAEIWAQLYSWPQPRHASTESDGSGYFSLALPTTGEWRFHVRAPGWEISDRGWNIVLGHNFAAQIGTGGRDDLRFDVPQGRIAGTVKDSDGRPIAGYDVGLSGTFDWRGGSATTTDSTGRFAFLDLAPGSYLVSCGGALFWGKHSEMADSPLDCERVTLATPASSIDDVELRLEPSGELEIELIAFEGADVPAWTPLLARPAGAPDGYWNLATQTGEGGAVRPGGRTYLRGLPAGLIEHSFRSETAALAAPLDATVKIDPEGRAKASVRLVASTRVLVRANDAKGKPQFIRIVRVGTSAGRSLDVFDDWFGPMLKLPALPPGEYKLTIADPAGRLYEQTIKLNGEPERDVLFQL